MREVRDSDRRRDGAGHAGEAWEKLKKKNVGGQKGEILASSLLPGSHMCVCDHFITWEKCLVGGGKQEKEREAGIREGWRKQRKREGSSYGNGEGEKGNDGNRKDKKEEVCLNLFVFFLHIHLEKSSHKNV